VTARGSAPARQASLIERTDDDRHNRAAQDEGKPTGQNGSGASSAACESPSTGARGGEFHCSGTSSWPTPACGSMVCRDEGRLRWSPSAAAGCPTRTGASRSAERTLGARPTQERGRPRPRACSLFGAVVRARIGHAVSARRPIAGAAPVAIDPTRPMSRHQQRGLAPTGTSTSHPVLVNPRHDLADPLGRQLIKQAERCISSGLRSSVRGRLPCSEVLQRGGPGG